MANKINAIQAILDRIEAAMQPDQPLAEVKNVRVCSIEEARKSANYPVINIDLLSGEEKDYYSQHGKIDSMSVEVSLICNKFTGESLQTMNGLFDGTSNGPLWLFEQLLNVLDKNTSGVVDLSFGSTMNRQPGYTYEVISNPTFIEFKIKMVCDTAQFQAGAR